MADRPEETVHVPDGPLAPAATGSFPTFGRFRTVAGLGEGAMGSVYRAHDDVLGRDVAIKVLHATDAIGVRERFLREARAIGAVLHPNILAVHDVGDEAGTPYLVMELAAAGSLRDRMKRGPLPLDLVREVGIQIARALAAAHGANILHRDVKPANVLLARAADGSDLWKLCDFGIARMPDSTLTIEGQFLGSPSYAAPESLRAGEFSPASDIYALGATLYEALAGAPPHGDHDMSSVIRKLEHDAPPLPLAGPVPAAIMAALSRDPARRPSADELARQLARVADDVVPAAAVSLPAAPSAVPAMPVPRASRRMMLAAALFALAAIVAIAIAIDKSRSGDTSNPLAPAGLRPVEEAESDEARAPEEPAEQPMVVDENGQPYDEETARAILEQMQRDADDSRERHPKKGKKQPHWKSMR